LALFQRNFRVLVVGWVVINFVQSIPKTYFSLYVDWLGGTAIQLAIIGSSSTVVTAVVFLLGGYLADIVGRRRIIIVCSLGIAVSSILYVVASSWEYVLVGALLNSVFLIHQPALESLTADSFHPKTRGFKYSVMTLIMNVVAIPSPLIAGYLLEQMGVVEGVRVGYLIVMGGWVIVLFARLKLQETLRVHESSMRWQEVLGMVPHAIRESIRVWTQVPSSMRYLFMTQCLGIMFAGIYGTYLILYSLDILAISRIEWAILSSLMFLVSVVVALPLGKLVDRFGRKTPLTLSWILNTVSTLLLLDGDFPRLIVSFIIFGLATALYTTAEPALLADLVPSALRGKVIGSQSFVTRLLSAAGLLVSGFLYEHVSPHLPFILYIAVTLPNIFIVYFLIREPMKREQ
jgi:MFS family permease